MPRFGPIRHCGLFRGGVIDHRWRGREAILNFDFTIRHRDIFTRNDLVYISRVYKRVRVCVCACVRYICVVECVYACACLHACMGACRNIRSTDNVGCKL